MIPKIIHYVWLGKGEKSQKIKDCIESWEKCMPDCTIKEWNEDNFDLDFCSFTRESYNKGQYAFTSDVVRLYALYTEGGIYLDADVEVKIPLDGFLDKPAFTGFEQPYYPVCATMGSEKGNPLIKEMLDYYNDKEFELKENWLDYKTNTVIMSEILDKHGIDRSQNKIQHTKDIWIYPQEYFNDKGGFTYHYQNGSWRRCKRR